METASNGSPFVSPGTDLVVVVVDTYGPGRQTMCACISELGHRAIGASSTEIAETLVRRSEADLVIVDHCPPWSDAWGFVARLREDLHVPAIVVSDGMDAVPFPDTLTLSRPVSLYDLERAIAQLSPATELR